MGQPPRLPVAPAGSAGEQPKGVEYCYLAACSPIRLPLSLPGWVGGQPAPALFNPNEEEEEEEGKRLEAG